MRTETYLQFAHELTKRTVLRQDGHPVVLADRASSGAAELLRIARCLHRIYERQCNGYSIGLRAERWDDAAEQRDMRREAKLEGQARQVAESLGATLYVQGDPRGWPLYLIFPGDLRPDRGETMENSYSRGVGVPPR